MRAIDLFCGCGGTAHGVKLAGIDVVAGYDVDDKALEVFNRHNDGRGAHLDLNDVDKAIEMMHPLAPDVLFGSPPCTDYSTAGLGAARDATVPHAHAALTVSFAKIAVALHPYFIVMENVRPLIASDEWRAARAIFEAHGYAVTWVVVNAAQCGVPQARNRLFVIASRVGSVDAVHRRAKDQCLNGSKTVVQDVLPELGSFYLHPRNIRSPGIFAATAPAPTLRTNCLVRKPRNDRYVSRHGDACGIAEASELSIDDAAALASFPSGYFDLVRRTAAGRMIGNCVPPLMAMTVARWCLEALVPDAPLVAPQLDWARNPITRVPRIDRLVRAGFDGAVDAAPNGGRCVVYTTGTSPSCDAAVAQVLHVPSSVPGIVVTVRERTNATITGGQAPVDDLYIEVTQLLPGQVLRSARQVAELVGGRV